MGLILKNVSLPYPNHGHVILAHPAPVLVYPISSTEARMLVDLPADACVSCIRNSAQTNGADAGAAGAGARGGGLRNYLLHHTLPQLPKQLQDALKSALEDGGLSLIHI